MQKPYYSLDFGATMCKFQIKVNNFEVFMLNIDGNVASEIPLNGGIFGSGEQQLEVRLDGNSAMVLENKKHRKNLLLTFGYVKIHIKR